MSSNVQAIVLAAGKGTRMKSDMAKVLHPVFFSPMVTHVIDVLKQLHLEKIVVVTGHQCNEVEKSLSGFGVSFARQKDQLGTGHAVLSAQDSLNKEKSTVLILCGDTPVIRTETLQEFIDSHTSEGSTLTVMSTVLDNPTNYGRVMSSESGNVTKIVEEKDASPEERLVCEVNAGIYCVEQDFLFDALSQVGTDNAQGEVYLTDIVQIAVNENKRVGKFLCNDPLEITGVNSRIELATAHKILQQRRNNDLMLQGITMFDPDTISVESSVSVGRDTLIYGSCHLGGKTVIGEGCIIEPYVNLKDCEVLDRSTVVSFTNCKGTKVTPN